jgi:hypothetical protein
VDVLSLFFSFWMSFLFADGPVYLGHDVIWHETPNRIYRNETFLLPPELEVMVEDWRTIAALPITPEE